MGTAVLHQALSPSLLQYPTQRRKSLYFFLDHNGSQRFVFPYAIPSAIFHMIMGNISSIVCELQSVTEINSNDSARNRYPRSCNLYAKIPKSE